MGRIGVLTTRCSSSSFFACREGGWLKRFLEVFRIGTRLLSAGTRHMAPNTSLAPGRVAHLLRAPLFHSNSIFLFFPFSLLRAPGRLHFPTNSSRVRVSSIPRARASDYLRTSSVRKGGGWVLLARQKRNIARLEGCCDLGCDRKDT